MIKMVEMVTEGADVGLIVFSVLLAITILIMLLTISSIHRKLRLIASDLQSIRKEQSVMSDEMEMLASIKPDQGQAEDPPAVVPPNVVPPK